MKVLVIVLMAPVMMMFFLAGIQTIEWCLDSGVEIPWQAYALLGAVAVWCVIVASLGEKTLKKINRFFDKLIEE